MTVTEFLTARIAEDEAAANYANTGVRWASWNRSWDTGPQRDIAAGGVRLFTVPTLYDEHIARHDPARVLAECEAKRRIVELHSVDCYVGTGPDGDDEYFCSGCSRADTGYHPDDVRCPTLCALASVYADHPDYDEAWRP